MSRSASWSLGHGVAIATAAFLTRGSLAFLYLPVIGEVSALRKYGHNVVLLALVSLACDLAWRATRTHALTARQPGSQLSGTVRSS